jgi:signal transduction histidine kinase
VPQDNFAELAEEARRIAAENARLLERLAGEERRFRLISRGVLRVQEAERGRISRELHDGVGQCLTALKLQLDLTLLAARAEAPALAERLEELRELAEQALQEVRQIARLIRPQMLDELGLLPTLQWLTRSLGERSGIAIELVHAGLDERLDPDVETLAFRVVQEALTNVVRHSAAPSASVSLAQAGGRLKLSVSDSGKGFDPAGVPAGDAGAGFGLKGMRDRVQLLGGHFAVTSSAGAGTRIEAEVPTAPPRETLR